MHQVLIHRLIGRVLSGEASPIEERELAKWLEQSEENRAAYASVKEGWGESRINIVYPRQEEVFQKIQSSIRRLPAEKQDALPEKSRSFQWQRYAALLTFFISATAIVLWLVITQEQEHNTSPRLTVKSTPTGSKLKFYLPDGSTVWLNAGSALQYPENFEENQRCVQLEGEAFFSVVADSLRPFVVRTEGLATKVLGTSFNIRALPRFNDIEVSVLTGVVEVASGNFEGPSASAVLRPAEMAVYQKATGKLTTQNCDIGSLVCWKDGIILFVDSDIDRVVRELERWYGVDFILDSKLNIDHSITAKFDNRSLEYVLDGLSYISSIGYKIEKNKVYLFNN